MVDPHLKVTMKKQAAQNKTNSPTANKTAAKPVSVVNFFDMNKTFQKESVH